MDWIALCVLCVNIAVLQARHDLDIKKLVEIIMRRNGMYNPSPILGAPRYPEHLPEAEPILPGHTLIRPAKGMLKSAVKFPLRDLEGSLVYGNEDNIGLSFGKDQRVMYTNFRKSNNLLASLARYIQETKKNQKYVYFRIFYSKSWIIVIDSSAFKGPISQLQSVVTHTDDENDAREIIDELDPGRNFFEDNGDFRRKRSRSKYRKRSNEYSNSESQSESSGSSEHEHNPGNPYTIHKNKYNRNWLWNHFMDGDHMNINPNSPKFKNAGPSGSELFFGRKWWYFNQDDYKPMR